MTAAPKAKPIDLPLFQRLGVHRLVDELNLKLLEALIGCGTRTNALHNHLALLLGDSIHNAVNVPTAANPIQPTMPSELHRTLRKRVFR
jgi:hypothetical protein